MEGEMMATGEIKLVLENMKSHHKLMPRDQDITFPKIEETTSKNEMYLDLVPMTMKMLCLSMVARWILTMDLDPDSMLHQL